MLLGTQAGFDPRVPLALDGKLDMFNTVDATRATLAEMPTLDDVRVGWLGDLDGYLAFEPGILDRCADGLARMAAVGASVEAASIAMSAEAVWEAWRVWRHATTSAGLGPLSDPPGRRERIKPEALWEIDQGRLLSFADFNRASEVRTTFHGAITELFRRYDVLAIPTAQVWPFPVEQRWPTHIGDRAMDTYHRWMEVTIYASFAGLPAISVPVGFDERRLPMGMQLIGRPRGDVEVLQVAHAYEQTIADLRVGEA
jgi:amidase